MLSRSAIPSRERSPWARAMPVMMAKVTVTTARSVQDLADQGGSPFVSRGREGRKVRPGSRVIGAGGPCPAWLWWKAT